MKNLMLKAIDAAFPFMAVFGVFAIVAGVGELGYLFGSWLIK